MQNNIVIKQELKQELNSGKQMAFAISSPKYKEIKYLQINFKKSCKNTLLKSAEILNFFPKIKVSELTF